MQTLADLVPPSTPPLVATDLDEPGPRERVAAQIKARGEGLRAAIVAAGEHLLKATKRLAEGKE